MGTASAPRRTRPHRTSHRPETNAPPRRAAARPWKTVPRTRSASTLHACTNRFSRPDSRNRLQNKPVTPCVYRFSRKCNGEGLKRELTGNGGSVRDLGSRKSPAGVTPRNLFDLQKSHGPRLDFLKRSRCVTLDQSGMTGRDLVSHGVRLRYWREPFSDALPSALRHVGLHSRPTSTRHAGFRPRSTTLRRGDLFRRQVGEASCSSPI